MIKKICHIEEDKRRMIDNKKVWNEITEDFFDIKDTVVLALAGDNKKLDNNALLLLPCFVQRKKAQRAEILVLTENEKWVRTIVKKHLYMIEARVKAVSRDVMIKIFDYYCFAFNLDNIAFTFLNHCHYNLMGKVLDETSITEMEAVCLGVYWLNELPGKIADERR